MANEISANVTIGNNQWLAVWHHILRMARAGWWIRASSDGVTKVVSDDPTAHAGNTGTGFSPVALAGQTGVLASATVVEAHPNGQLVTLTGLTGLLAPNTASGRSEGNYITLSGAAQAGLNTTHHVYEVLSVTSCKICVRAGGITANDANNGLITWTEKDITSAPNYGSLGVRKFWCLLEGPEVFQLQFTTAVVGEFLRGEAVTQTGTTATGEVIGVVWDPILSAGWAVIMPRTGTWNGTGVITGAASGATVTPTVRYRWRRQIVWFKGSVADNHTGSAWYNAFNHETAAHVTESYLTKASNVNCIADVAPGGTTLAGNRQVLPATNGNFHVIRCRNNSTHDGATALVHTDGIIAHTNGTGLSSNGRLQTCATNVMPRAGRSADGTWWLFHGNTAFAGGNLLASLRVDGGDDGHCDPWVSYAQCNSSSTRDVRYETVNTTTISPFLATNDLQSTNSLNEWMSAWNTHVNRLGVAQGTHNFGRVGWTTAPPYTNPLGVMGSNLGGTQRLVAHPAAIPPGFKEPVGFFEGLRGRARWMYLVQQGAMFNTFEGRRYMCISDYLGGTRQGVIIGPWDQVSDPVQS